MKATLWATLSLARDGGPLATIDGLPGDAGAELRPQQLRDLADALLHIAVLAETRKAARRGRPLPALRISVDVGAE